MGFLRGWCENLGGEREKKGREKKDRRCQTTRNLATCTTLTRQEHRDLLNTALKGGV
jgi:hypothetical protein